MGVGVVTYVDPCEGGHDWSEHEPVCRRCGEPASVAVRHAEAQAATSSWEVRFAATLRNLIAGLYMDDEPRRRAIELARNVLAEYELGRARTAAGPPAFVPGCDVCGRHGGHAPDCTERFKAKAES